jgi:predicted acyl esterase
MNIRHPGEKFELRTENEWPLARTQWTKFYLDPVKMALSRESVSAEGKLDYEALGKGLTACTSA